MAARLGDDERALELTRVFGVDPEVGRQLHGALDPLGDIDERTVGEYRRVETGKEVVTTRHDRAEIFLDQLRMLADGFRDRTEDHAGVGELLLECRCHRHTVEHRVHRHIAVAGGVGGAFHAREHFLLTQRDAELLVGFEKLGVDFVQALGLVLGAFRGGIVGNRLIVDRLVMQMRPFRRAHLFPLPECFEAPVEHPFRLVFLGRNEADDILVQPRRNRVGFQVGDETGFVFALGDKCLDVFLMCGHSCFDR